MIRDLGYFGYCWGAMFMGDRFNLLEYEDKWDNILNKSIFYADAFVNKKYLINLNKYPVVRISDEDRDQSSIRFSLVERVVFDENEIANDKLISVYNALANIGSSVILMIVGEKRKISFYLGVNDKNNVSMADAILRKGFIGNFPGSKLTNISSEKMNGLLDGIMHGNNKCVSSVSIVPSPRDEDKLQFVQGIEKFIDTMKGESYTAVIIADPVSKETLERRKNGLLEIQTNLSPFSSTQLSYGVNHSSAVSKGMSESISRTINSSISNTNSSSESKTTGRNKGHSFGFFGIGFNSGTSESVTAGNSWARAVTEGTSDTKGTTATDTDTHTDGDSKTITITNENRAVRYLSERIDQHLERIKSCESFGLWDVASYFISENIQTSVVAASTYKALMAGNESGVENSYVNIWNSKDNEYTDDILEYIRYCRNPRLLIPRDDNEFSVDEQIVDPCSLINGNELPYLMGLPKKAVSGLSVRKMAEFGRNAVFVNDVPEGKKISFGHVYHMGEVENDRVDLDIESFRSHCFITGSTGSGKSNTTYKILDEMIKNDIPFLVIEPAKGEYKRYYGNLPGVNIFCTNPRYFSMLRLNPFKFNRSIHVLEHLDRLIEIFNACWPLYAAMPAILKESFELAYVKCGWDLDNSIYIPTSYPKYPTFKEVLAALPEVINSSEYSSETKGNYIGSLVTRVKSLTNGITGQVLSAGSDIDDSVLFDRNTIIDLSRVSSLETKSLIMGLMILKLNEYRMCTSEENQPLRHLTILEEAHNILKRGSGGGAESADVQGKSVEMISASIAEMRTYGEGFVIVDQSPGAVDISAIKNTNTKVIMRLPDYDDSITAGRAIGLTDVQMAEIPKFPMGVAAVYQSGWAEAVLTKIDKSKGEYHADADEVTTVDVMAALRGDIALTLINQFEMFQQGEDIFDIEAIVGLIYKSEASSFKKSEIAERVIDAVSALEKSNINISAFSDTLMDMTECEGLLRLTPITFGRDYSDMLLSKEAIDKNDASRVRKWYFSVYENLDEYVYIEDEERKRRLIRYIIYGMRDRYPDSNKYHIIYKCLYS